MVADNSKEVIKEADYNLKLANCSLSALKVAIFSSITAAVGLPIILKKLTFLRTTFELRMFSSMLIAIPAGYFMAKNKRFRCLKNVEDSYEY